MLSFFSSTASAPEPSPVPVPETSPVQTDKNETSTTAPPPTDNATVQTKEESTTPTTAPIQIDDEKPAFNLMDRLPAYLVPVKQNAQPLPSCTTGPSSEGGFPSVEVINQSARSWRKVFSWAKSQHQPLRGDLLHSFRFDYLASKDSYFQLPQGEVGFSKIVLEYCFKGSKKELNRMVVHEWSIPNPNESCSFEWSCFPSHAPIWNQFCPGEFNLLFLSSIPNTTLVAEWKSNQFESNLKIVALKNCFSSDYGDGSGRKLIYMAIEPVLNGSYRECALLLEPCSLVFCGLPASLSTFQKICTKYPQLIPGKQAQVPAEIPLPTNLIQTKGKTTGEGGLTLVQTLALLSILSDAKKTESDNASDSDVEEKREKEESKQNSKDLLQTLALLKILAKNESDKDVEGKKGEKAESKQNSKDQQEAKA